MHPDVLTVPLPTDRQTGEAENGRAWHEDAALLTRRRLDELERLRGAGMEIVRKMEDWLDGAVSDEELSVVIGGRAVVSEFCRVARAVRQVIVLELELTGQRPAPDRDAVREPREETEEAPERGGWRLRDDLNDYDNGPLDQVVAKVRKVVRLEAPADDPFAPPELRQARVAARGSDEPEPSGRTAVAECQAGSGDVSASAASPPPSPSRRKATGPSLSRGAGEGNSVRTALLSGVAAPVFYDEERSRGPPG